MKRLNLILADTDELYIDSLSRYIRNLYGVRFNINIFTKMNSLIGFLGNNTGKADIMIVSQDLYKDNLSEYSIDMVILLTESKYDDDHNGLPCIGKYQPGDKIINRILYLYSDIFPDIGFIFKDGKPGKIITVYSPQGGSGKTVISVNLARFLARQGLKTLYLNLESINSSVMIENYSENNEYGLSDLIYNIKNNKSNLTLKIDSYKSYSERFGISYFKPFHCSLELEEITEEDIGILLFKLRQTGQFDRIVIDTDSIMNKCKIALLCSSDCILTVLSPDIAAKYKLAVFEADLKKILAEGEQNLYNRIMPVINKYNDHPQTESIFFNNIEVKDRIPCLNDIFVKDDGIWGINPESGMTAYMKEVYGKMSDTLFQ